ncbi:MAG: methionine--tRNA ligase subunit beta [Candidatus Micrarchaeota archaeon]
MDAISFEDFSKVQLRVAKIMGAEKVEGSNKLYKLQIRIGEEIRTLVAGIAEYYAEDELLGKKIIIVANLEPKKLKGIESQGMLLAAQSADGGLALLTLDSDLPDGSEIH